MQYTKVKQAKVFPLETTAMTELLKAGLPTMIWHLHANNVGAVPVTVEIHLGDTTQTSINTLLATLYLPPYGSDTVPMTLSKFSLEAGAKLSAKASVGAAANVVVNTGELV